MECFMGEWMEARKLTLADMPAIVLDSFIYMTWFYLSALKFKCYPIFEDEEIEAQTG